jgi:hypothetical protein
MGDQLKKKTVEKQRHKVIILKITNQSKKWPINILSRDGFLRLPQVPL